MTGESLLGTCLRRSHNCHRRPLSGYHSIVNPLTCLLDATNNSEKTIISSLKTVITKIENTGTIKGGGGRDTRKNLKKQNRSLGIESRLECLRRLNIVVDLMPMIQLGKILAAIAGLRCDSEALHISHRWKRVDAGNRLSLTSDASSTTCLMFKQWTAFKLKPHPPGQRRSIYLLYFIIASSFNVTDAKTAVLTWTNDPLVPTHCCAGNRI